ncbi:hypothetical protein ACFU4W_27710, partial [Streptomyces sp. NPDC057417]
PTDHAYDTAQGDAAAAPGHHGPSDSGGLPRRRRRNRATAPAPASAPDTPARRGPEESAAALAALQSGTAAARSATGSNAGTAGAVPGVAGAAPASGAAAATAAPAPEDTEGDTDGNDHIHHHEGGTAR